MRSGLPIGGLGSLPPATPRSGPPSMRIDVGHVSRHFIHGQGEGTAPLTQRIILSDGKSGKLDLHISTPVDGNGNVGETTIDIGDFAGEKFNG